MPAHGLTLGVVPTPLATPVTVPAPRTGGWDAALDAALVPAAGLEAVRARLHAPGALVVTTGQQPALFTGPLYTVHKALSAAALAAQLEARWQRPVVPVFWSAGDDHDFAEANHCSWPAADGTVRTHVLRERPPEAPQRPLWREPLGEEVEAAFAQLEADLGPSEQRDWTLAWLRRHFRPEQAIAAADREALAELLAPAGVLVLDSTHRAVKAAAAPWLLQALRTHGTLEARLDARRATLAAEGRDPGIATGDGATLVMLEDAAGRDRLVVDGAGFRTRRGRRHVSSDELERIAAEDPQRLSANVLLRPVVESALLPTVAYVAGPGELRYLELVRPLYEALGVVRQAPVPRWSGVLVEPKVERVLQKFGIPLADLLEPAGPLEARVIRGQLPESLLEALSGLRTTLEEVYGTVEREAATIDPTLVRPVQAIRQAAVTGTHDAEKKLLQHLRKRQETELQQLARARASVLPDGKPQERVHTAAAFLAREGPALVPGLLAAITDWYGGRLEGAPAAS